MLEKLKTIGPGAMVAAAFIGPGTVLTATMAGSSYGYTLLWAVAFSTFATYVLQEMCARLGIIGNMGLGEAIRKKIKHPGIKIAASLLVISAVFIGNAAYEAGNISGAVLGFESISDQWDLGFNPFVLIIGMLAFALLFSGKYKLIETALIVLVSVMGFVFLISAFMVKPDWLEVLKGLFIPSIPNGALLMIVGLIGTTVVPYNLFLHASAVKKKWPTTAGLKDAKTDTLLSVVFGGIITMAILITAAAAFETGDASISSVKDLAKQLEPLLGSWSVTFIAFGFLAAGLSSSITAPLAAAFASSEIFEWGNNLKDSKFRLVWLTVLLIGIIFSSLGFKSTAVIIFAQIANGLLLPIIACYLLWIMNDKALMKDHTNSLWANVFGGLVILITFGIGMKGILKAMAVI
jgi:Mn2+/Fe2+ NRAMP family transporter